MTCPGHTGVNTKTPVCQPSPEGSMLGEGVCELRPPPSGLLGSPSPGRGQHDGWAEHPGASAQAGEVPGHLLCCLSPARTCGHVSVHAQGQRAAQNTRHTPWSGQSPTCLL